MTLTSTKMRGLNKKQTERYTKFTRKQEWKIHKKIRANEC